jgi:hypothetical protein
VGGGVGWIGAGVFACVFLRFFGFGALVNCGDSDGDLKSGGHIPWPGSLYGVIPKLCVIFFTLYTFIIKNYYLIFLFSINK